MGWKMTKEAALKRQKAERLFEEGFGPLKVSRELEVNFYIVRDWKTAWKNKVEKRNQGNTPLNRTIASDTATELWEKCLTFPAFGSVGTGPDSIASFQSCKQGKARGAKNENRTNSVFSRKIRYES